MSAEHRALALRAVEESIVLLRNERQVKSTLSDGPLLPLAESLKAGARVAVIGPAANDSYRVMGERCILPHAGWEGHEVILWLCTCACMW